MKLLALILALVVTSAEARDKTELILRPNNCEEVDIWQPRSECRPGPYPGDFAKCDKIRKVSMYNLGEWHTQEMKDRNAPPLYYYKAMILVARSVSPEQMRKFLMRRKKEDPTFNGGCSGLQFAYNAKYTCVFQEVDGGHTIKKYVENTRRPLNHDHED